MNDVKRPPISMVSVAYKWPFFYRISYKSFLESDRYDGDGREAVPFENL